MEERRVVMQNVRRRYVVLNSSVMFMTPRTSSNIWYSQKGVHARYQKFEFAIRKGPLHNACPTIRVQRMQVQHVAGHLSRIVSALVVRAELPILSSLLSSISRLTAVYKPCSGHAQSCRRRQKALSLPKTWTALPQHLPLNPSSQTRQ